MNVFHGWIVDADVLIYNNQKERIGYVDVDGAVYTADLGTKQGFVGVNGDTHDGFNSLKGSVDLDRVMCDEPTNVIHSVDVSGLIYNAQQRPTGSVRRKTHPRVQEAERKDKPRKTIFGAAAGAVILLGEQME